MTTTSDVLDNHLKCFGENDLDGVLADYSSDVVLFIPDRPLKGLAAIKPSAGTSGPAGIRSPGARSLCKS